MPECGTVDAEDILLHNSNLLFEMYGRFIYVLYFCILIEAFELSSIYGMLMKFKRRIIESRRYGMTPAIILIGSQEKSGVPVIRACSVIRSNMVMCNILFTLYFDLGLYFLKNNGYVFVCQNISIEYELFAE